MAFHAFHTLSFPWPSSGVAGNSILAIIVAPASDPAHETERGYLSFKDGELNMGYVPKDAEWYLAEIVQELADGRVGGPHNHLVRVVGMEEVEGRARVSDDQKRIAEVLSFFEKSGAISSK